MAMLWVFFFLHLALVLLQDLLYYKRLLSPWCCVSVVAAHFRFVLVSCGHISFPTLLLCSTLTRIAQNDFYPIMYMHISCVGLCVHGFMNPMPR